MSDTLASFALFALGGFSGALSIMFLWIRSRGILASWLRLVVARYMYSTKEPAESLARVCHDLSEMAAFLEGNHASKSR